MKRLIGQCSCCGGNVFENYGNQPGTEAPISCISCGAILPTNLPVINMTENVRPQLLQE